MYICANRYHLYFHQHSAALVQDLSEQLLQWVGVKGAEKGSAACPILLLLISMSIKRLEHLRYCACEKTKNKKTKQTNKTPHKKPKQKQKQKQNKKQTTHRSLPRLPWWDTTDAEVNVPSPKNSELLHMLSVKPGVDQNIALHASPIARNVGFLIPASLVHAVCILF